MVAGERVDHVDLERCAAELVRLPEALVFTSGYAANVGLLSALAGSNDLIVSDALNHASLVDGARLSRARIVVTPHLDTGAVAKALAEKRSGRAFVVTESYFSMDADSPDLVALRGLCDVYGAGLIVDEAHALGVLGPDGRGLCAATGVQPDALSGTFGKAFGAAGAFVAGCPSLVTWLWNRARSFVFSTGLSPAIAAAASAGIQVAAQEADRRERALALARQLRDGLAAIGVRPLGFGHVIPWVIGDAAAAMHASEALRVAGIDVRAIRSPSVPAGTARLRFATTAAHASRGGYRAGRGGPGVRIAREPAVNPGRLIAVSGTGTEIGKTHFSEALLLALRRVHSRVAGLKPIETGWSTGIVSDAARLEGASSFHVKHFGYVFSEPISPHLAAREANTPIRFDVLVPLISAARASAEVLLVELPGGLFTPLSDTTVNADLIQALAPDLTLLVAQDRLGVLHEVGSTLRAARAANVALDGIVLVVPQATDTSTGRNAAELERLVDVPVVARMARGTPKELASYPDFQALAERVSHGAWG